MDLRSLIAFELVDLSCTAAAFALLLRELTVRSREAAGFARLSSARHRTLRLSPRVQPHRGEEGVMARAELAAAAGQPEQG